MTTGDEKLHGSCAGGALVRDPVCGMMVDPRDTAWRESYEGRTYFFCNPRCARKFRAHPAHYVEALALIWKAPAPGAPRTDRAEQVRRKYRRNVGWYDLAVAGLTSRLRKAAVERLALAEGARVLDLGCGTGLSLPLLRAAVGAGGAVYGVDLSPHMLATARRRSSEAGWTNVHLIEADAEDFQLPADGRAAVLLHQRHPPLADGAAPCVRPPAARRACRGCRREAGSGLARHPRESDHARLLRVGRDAGTDAGAVRRTAGAPRRLQRRGESSRLAVPRVGGSSPREGPVGAASPGQPAHARAMRSRSGDSSRNTFRK